MEAYKKEFIEFMVDCQVLFADSARTMPRRSRARSDLISTCCSDPPTREFRFL